MAAISSRVGWEEPGDGVAAAISADSSARRRASDLEIPQRLASRSSRAAVAGSKATLVRTVMVAIIFHVMRITWRVKIADGVGRRWDTSAYLNWNEEIRVKWDAADHIHHSDGLPDFMAEGLRLKTCLMGVSF